MESKQDTLQVFCMPVSASASRPIGLFPRSTLATLFALPMYIRYVGTLDAWYLCLVFISLMSLERAHSESHLPPIHVSQWPIPIPADGEAVVFNPPKGCVEGERTVTVDGVGDFSEPNGIQTCPPTKDQLSWTIFPWVRDTNGLTKFPGCGTQVSNPINTVITYQSNPAFTGEAVATGDYEAQLCQNFLFTDDFGNDTTTQVGA